MIEVGSKAGNDLDFYDFVDFLILYRRREGFRRDECAKMQHLFERFDVDESGEVNALELIELFRHLGHRVTLDEVHVFLRQVDENESNCLDFREYLRLMRLHREDELSHISAVFKQFVDPNEAVVMPGIRVPHALEALGHTAPDSLENEALNFESFVQLVDVCRASSVARDRKKAGFSDARIGELRMAFRRYDKNHSGDIDNNELLMILADFSWQPRSREEQSQLVQKLKTAKQRAQEAGVRDAGGPGEIGFWTFVQLARMLETEHERSEDAAVHALMVELGFSQKEVDDFRAIFLGKLHEVLQEQDEENTQVMRLSGLPHEDVKRLVRSLASSLSRQSKLQLDVELKNLGCTGDNPLEFPGFLRLMRWLATAVLPPSTSDGQSTSLANG